MVDTWNTNTNTNTNTYPDVDPANDYQVGEQTGSYLGTGSGYDTNNTTNNTTANNTKSDALYASSLASAAEADPYNILDAMTDISIIHGQTNLPGAAGQNNLTKYGKSWDFNPANPDNLIGWDTHTLGNMIMVDSSGNAILDSEGKPIFTSFGKSIYDEMNDKGLVGDPNALQDYVDALSFDELQDWERNYFDQNWYGSDYWDDYLGEYYGPTEQSAYEKNKRWQQKSLGEILQEGPVGFSDLQRIYGEELSETSGNPFAAVAQYNKQGAFSPSFGESIITEYS